ncbi:MAG: hypothetical protein QW146_07895 [Candidatus Bathyarchaeia archaeon]
MRLQKQLSRKAEGKEYSKWVIVISPKQIEMLGWKNGEEIEGEVRGGKLILKSATSKKSKKTARA